MSRDRRFVPCAMDLESRKLTASAGLEAGLGSSGDVLAASLTRMANQTPALVRLGSGQGQGQGQSPNSSASSTPLKDQVHQETMLARTFGAGTIQQAGIRPNSGHLINHMYPVIGLGQPISIKQELNDLVFLVVL